MGNDINLTFLSKRMGNDISSLPCDKHMGNETRGRAKGAVVNHIFYSVMSLLVPMIEQQPQVRQ
jgi:hypothetical protein